MNNNGTLKRNIYNKYGAAVQLFLIYAWLTNLPETDSFFGVYSLYAIAGCSCVLLNYSWKTQLPAGAFWGILGFSGVFSLSVLLGNYSLFEPFTALMNLLNMGIVFAGGVCIGVNVLLLFLDRFPRDTQKDARTREKTVFFAAFFSVVAVDLLYLFFVRYPAVVEYDTVAQLNQIAGGAAYSNWTPYWHTRTIELFYDLGYALFADPNGALATYVVFQVLFMAACSAYLLVTLYQLGLPKTVLWIAFYLYVLYPYNIVFNITIGKDILFGAALLLMLTALLRIILNTGKHSWWNYAVFAAGSCGFSMWRTNGWYILLVSAVFLTLAFRKKKKILVCVLLGVLAVCWLLNGPYIESQQIVGGDITELLAVPFQQIGRIIVNERELRPEDEVFLSELFRFEMVKEVYRPESADPMKFKAFRHSHMEFLEENMGSFLGVWFRLGLQYPGDYLKAWIDETRGYWNGGYDMGVYIQTMPSNDLGIYHSGGENVLAKLFYLYFRIVEDPSFMQPLKSIGFAVWLVLGCWWSNVMKKRTVSWIGLPVVILLLGLWIGTPVFAEFRYAYPIFLVSPLILFTSMFDTKKA